MRTQKSKKKKRPAQEPPTERCASCGGYYCPSGARNAVFHLRLIQGGGHIVDLYRKFFPKEFARDGIDYTSAHSLLASYDSFSSLVEKNLFPVWDFGAHAGLYDDPVYCLETMALCLYGNYHWFDRMQDLPDLPLVEKLIVNAWGEADPFKDEVGFFLPSDHWFDWERLAEVCDKERGPIKLLNVAAQLVTGQTGNFWLDICEEEYWQCEAPDWNETNIRYLASEYAEAKAMKADAERFFSWVGHSYQRIERVKALLRKGWRKKHERIRVKTHSGKPLVETLGGIL